jgi:hypothetical protein
MSGTVVHELASGEITLWIEAAGVIHIKTKNERNDPVELNDEEGLELSELLARLVSESRSNHKPTFWLSPSKNSATRLAVLANSRRYSAIGTGMSASKRTEDFVTPVSLLESPFDRCIKSAIRL